MKYALSAALVGFVVLTVGLVLQFGVPITLICVGLLLLAGGLLIDLEIE